MHKIRIDSFSVPHMNLQEQEIVLKIINTVYHKIGGKNHAENFSVEVLIILCIHREKKLAVQKKKRYSQGNA